MISLVYFLTLMFLLTCIGIAIITKYKNDTVAVIAVILCIIYIIIGWISKMFKSNSHGKTTKRTSSCIIGSNKKLSGILFGGCLDIWHIFHIVFWILIGLLSPKHWVLVLCLSIIWEVTEHFIFKYVFRNCEDVFCGRIEDIFSNMIGYSIGSYIATYLYSS